MDGTMKWDFHSIDGLVGEIRTNVSTVEGRLAELKQKVTNLSQVWEGAADAGFQQTQRDWVAAADDLNAALQRIHIAVNDSNLSAQEVERLNAARWS